MLYRLAEQVDGRRDVEGIAESFSEAVKRRIQPSDAQMLIDQQLRPLGIVAPPAGDEPAELNKVDPLLALKFRAALVPDRAVRSVTTIFRPLFLPPVVAAVVLPLHVDRWVDRPRQSRGATFDGHPSDQITGTVDLPNALADLNQLTGGQVRQATGSDSSIALEKTLRSSSFRAVVGSQDHLLRQLELRVDLAPSLAAARSGLPNQGLSIAFDVQLSPKPLA